MNLERQRVLVMIDGDVALADTGTFDRERLDAIVEDLDALLERRHQVLVVSTASVELGRVILGIPEPLSLAERQVCAAVGYDHLTGCISELLVARGRFATPIILSGRDFSDRNRKLNVRIALNELLALRTTPLIGCNPAATVPRRTSASGLDQAIYLAVLVAATVAADTIIFRTSGSPYVSPTTMKSSRATSATPRDTRHLGTLAALAGAQAIIIPQAERSDICDRIARREHPSNNGSVSCLTPRRGPDDEPILVVGARTHRELVRERSDILTGSIRLVSGRFGSRTPVQIRDTFGNEIARGIVNQSSETLQRTRGLSPHEAKSYLRSGERLEVVLAEEMVLIDDAA